MMSEVFPMKCRRIFHQIAASMGIPSAMNMVGRYLDEGQGCDKDCAKAVEWYRRAASKGHAIAAYNLAQVLFEGGGVPVDRVEALRWYQVAAHGGFRDAMSVLGRAYWEGWEGEENPAQAHGPDSADSGRRNPRGSMWPPV